MLQIRPCCKEDFADIARLLRQLWPGAAIEEAALLEAYLNGLSGSQQSYFCALEAGRIVGFCSLSFKNSLWQQGALAHMDELIVDERARNRGIATQLLLAAKRIALSRRAALLELDSAFHRTGAHQFYERQGFQNRAYLFSLRLTADTGEERKDDDCPAGNTRRSAAHD